MRYLAGVTTLSHAPDACTGCDGAAGSVCC